MIYFISISDITTHINVGVVIVEALDEPTSITKGINIGIKDNNLSKTGKYNILATECSFDEFKQSGFIINKFYTKEQMHAKGYGIQKTCQDHGYNVNMTAFRN